MDGQIDPVELLPAARKNRNGSNAGERSTHGVATGKSRTRGGSMHIYTVNDKHQHLESGRCAHNQAPRSRVARSNEVEDLQSTLSAATGEELRNRKFRSSTVETPEPHESYGYVTRRNKSDKDLLYSWGCAEDVLSADDLPGRTSSYSEEQSSHTGNARQGKAYAPKRVVKSFQVAKRRDIDALKRMAVDSDFFDSQDSAGNTVFHKLIKTGNPEDQAFVESLLKNETLNFDVNIQDGKGRTLLHLASESRNFELTKTLVALGADASIEDADGKVAPSLFLNEKN